MYLAIFLPLKTNNQDCKQKKVDNQWKNKLKTFHGPFLQNIQSISEGLKIFYNFIVSSIQYTLLGKN